MEDVIEINIRALTEKQRNVIEKILDEQQNLYEDEMNGVALEVLQKFYE